MTGPSVPFPPGWRRPRSPHIVHVVQNSLTTKHACAPPGRWLSTNDAIEQKGSMLNVPKSDTIVNGTARTDRDCMLDQVDVAHDRRVAI